SERYDGFGLLVSALVINKYRAKLIFSLHVIPVANSMAFDLKDSKSFAHVEEEINANFEVPFVTKPNSEGSTLGLTIVNDKSQIFEALKNAKKSDNTAIVEQFIEGIELTVPVKGKKGNEKTHPMIQINTQK